MSEWFKRYRKFIIAALGAGAVAVQAAMTDGTITVNERWAIGFAVLAALGVVVVPNAPKTPTS